MDYQLPAQNMSIAVDNNANGTPTAQQQLQQLMLVNSCKNDVAAFAAKNICVQRRILICHIHKMPESIQNIFMLVDV